MMEWNPGYLLKSFLLQKQALEMVENIFFVCGLLFIGELVLRAVTTTSSKKSSSISSTIAVDIHVTLVNLAWLRLHHLPALKGHRHMGPQ